MGSDGRTIKAGSVARSKGFYGFYDAWHAALLTHLGPNTAAYTFEEVLAGSHKILGVEQVTDKGRRLYRVEFQAGGLQQELWFDPSVNFLVRKRMVTDASTGPAVRGGAEVLEFKEVTPGIYFPARVSLIEVDAQARETPGTFVVSFDHIRVNDALPSSFFHLDFTPGTLVTDSVQNREYRVGTNGEAIVDANKRVGSMPPPAQMPQRVTGPNADSDWSYRWLVGLSMCLLAIAFSLNLVRRARLKVSKSI